EDVAEAAAACRTTFGEIEAAEVKGNVLRGGAAAPAWCAAKSTSAKAAAAGVGLGRRGIDVVGVVAELVVYLPLFGIAQNVIGLGDFFELLLRLLVARIDVRMILARKLAEGLANVFRRGGLLHPEGAVIIFSCCSHLIKHLFSS